MDKLVITVTCDSTMSFPRNPYNPQGVEALADEYVRGVAAGAAICHLHGPYFLDEKIRPDGTKLYASAAANSKIRTYGYSGGNFGYPPACFATDVVLTTRDAGHSVVVGQGSRASHVLLTNAGKMLLRKRGSLTVRIAATMGDFAGTRERRHGRAVLSSPSSN